MTLSQITHFVCYDRKKVSICARPFPPSGSTQRNIKAGYVGVIDFAQTSSMEPEGSFGKVCASKWERKRSVTIGALHPPSSGDADRGSRSGNGASSNRTGNRSGSGHTCDRKRNSGILRKDSTGSTGHTGCSTGRTFSRASLTGTELCNDREIPSAIWIYLRRVTNGSTTHQKVLIFLRPSNVSSRVILDGFSCFYGIQKLRELFETASSFSRTEFALSLLVAKIKFPLFLRHFEFFLGCLLFSKGVRSSRAPEG